MQRYSQTPLRRGHSALGAKRHQVRLAYSTDLAVKLTLIHERLHDMIQEARRLCPDHPSVTSSQYAMECGAQKWVNRHSNGLPFDKLLDIKLLFEVPRVNDEVGFAEEEFIEAFAPVFCPSSDPKEIKMWFLELDVDANGIVDWDEFSSHMMTTHHGEDRDIPSMYTTKGQEPEQPPTAQSLITKIACNPTHGEYYTASGDGSVRAWDSITLKDKGVFHHGNGCLVHTLSYVVETGRLVVCQYNRVTFIYHCGLKQGPGIRLERAFKGETLPMHKPAFSRLLRTCEYDPDSSIMESADSSQPSHVPRSNASRMGKHFIDVVLMEDLDKNVLCVEGMQRLYSSERTPDPFLYGLESGVVQLYSLTGKGNKPAGINSFETGARIKALEKWEVHKNWVTQVLAAPELQGFISSSLDCSLQVFDVVKGESYIRMQCDSSDGARGVHTFDYSVARNLLCSCGISRDATVWNPKARQKMFSLGDHRAPLVSVKFVDAANQLVTLSEDKTVKIWDVRTFRCVQTLIDKERRYPEDRFMALGYDAKGDSIVTCSGVPVVWRDVNTQARLETGTTWHNAYEGHLFPITACLYNPAMHHLVTADQSTVRVWELKTGVIVHKWTPDECQDCRRRITACTLDCDGRRLLLGFDLGEVQLHSFDGRPLKIYDSESKYEISCLLYARMHPAGYTGSSNSVLVIAGGHGKKIVVWPDQPIPLSTHAVAVGKGASYLPTQGQNVYSMDICSPSKLAVGVANGSVLLYNLNNMTLLSVNKHTFGVGGSFVKALIDPSTPRKSSFSFAEKVEEHGEKHDGDDSVGSPALPRGAYGEEPPASPTEAESDPRRRSRQMWQGCLTLGKKEETLGAASFTNFRNKIQSKLLSVTEALIYLTQDVLVTLHGDGDALIWRHRDGHYLEILARFPASFSSGEIAYAMCFDAETASLYTGDCEGIVSVFDVKGALRHEVTTFTPARQKSMQEGKKREPKRGIRKRDSFGVNTSRPVHNSCKVHLENSFNLQIAGVITQLRLVPDSPLLLVASNDCSVSLVHRTSGQIYTTLGALKNYPNSWPQGLPEELQMPAEPVPIDPKRNETIFLKQHRFGVSFPDECSGGRPVNSLDLLNKKPEESTDDVFGLPSLKPPTLQSVASKLISRGKSASAFRQSKVLILDEQGTPRGPEKLFSLRNGLLKPDRKSSTTHDNAVMYERFCSKRIASGNTIPPPVEDTLPKGGIDTHKVEGKKRQKSCKRFAYTTVRQIQGVHRPSFQCPRWKEHCMCPQCKNLKGKDDSTHGVHALPVF